MSISGQGQPDLPHPALQSILLCDCAIREAGTNRVTIVGIFDRLFGRRFPMPYLSPLAVYVRLTDAEGEYGIRLELVRLDDEVTIGRIEKTSTIANRIGAHEIIFTMAGVVFERPGGYEWRVFANGRHVGGMRMTVLQQDQSPRRSP